MKNIELRVEISKILVKWGMPTRQAAIIEIAKITEKILVSQYIEILEKMKEKVIGENEEFINRDAYGYWMSGRNLLREELRAKIDELKEKR